MALGRRSKSLRHSGLNVGLWAALFPVSYFSTSLVWAFLTPWEAKAGDDYRLVWAVRCVEAFLVPLYFILVSAAMAPSAKFKISIFLSVIVSFYLYFIGIPRFFHAQTGEQSLGLIMIAMAGMGAATILVGRFGRNQDQTIDLKHPAQ